MRSRSALATLAALALWTSMSPALVAGVAPFTEEALSRGLVYTIQDSPQSSGVYGFGCAFADLDDDGDADAIILGAANGRVGVFENDGAGNFTDRSFGNGLPLLAEPAGLSVADIDGDGDLDLYLTQVGEPNVLALGDGDFGFTDVSAAAGVDDAGAGQGPAFGDFDGDGWLDLYLPNYNGLVSGTESLDNRLYRNLGDGTFEDVSTAQTVNDSGYGFQGVWTDFDRDGDLDLYLSNDRGHLSPFKPNQLWENVEGSLVNISAGSGADVALFSMGVAYGDFDGNRYPDLYCTNIGPPGGWYNPLLLNQGTGVFVESSAAAGVDHNITSWGSIFFDFNNDARLDLFVNNMQEPNTLYDCVGGFPCTDVSAMAAIGGRDDESYGSAVADVDGDGDLDLMVNNLGGNVELFINNDGTQRNWIRYRMRGEAPNLFAVGGSIDTRVGGDWQLREILAGGNGYLGQNEYEAHVGLDQATSVDEVVAVWPGGSPERTFTALPAGETWALFPPSALGDENEDGVVDIDDFQPFAACFEVPFAPGCERMDFDADSDVEIDDFDAFLLLFEGVLADCNHNGTEDLREILLGQLIDSDGDNVPDSCELFEDGFESGDTSAWSTVITG